MTAITRRGVPIPRLVDQPTSIALKQIEVTIGDLADEAGTALTTVEGRATTLEATTTDHETRVATIETRIPTPLADFADDAAAAAGGIAVGRFYRTASAVKVRVS